MNRPQKSVFLSYRRTDVGWALAVYQSLTHRGFDVFIDYLGLGSGQFEREILENIAARAHFLVLLTPGALDGVDRPDDWLRREVEYAIAQRRNVVPLLLKGFDLGSDAVRKRLTGGLAALAQFNGMRLPEDYFTAAIDRLERQFLAAPLDTELQPLSPRAEAAAREQQNAAEAASAAVPVAAPPPAPLPLPPAAASAAWPGNATRLAVRREGVRLLFDLTATSGSATASAVVQRDTIEPLLRRMTDGVWLPQGGVRRAMFQQVVPKEIRAALRQASALHLVLGEGCADIPWEMLQAEPLDADGQGLPLGIRTALVRQLAERPDLPLPEEADGNADGRHALVIGNPSTAGFGEAFMLPTPHPLGGLLPLPAAEDEAKRVAELLGAAGYAVECMPGGAMAADVLAALHARPWSVLHLAAHGIVDTLHRDGERRSGAVLSDGVVLTAVELRALDTCPALAVFTCEHFGAQPAAAPAEPLAGNIVRELLGAGAKAVLASAGHANDDASRDFSVAFYRALLEPAADFGSAVHAARRAVWQAHPGDSTWASLQAWGEPGWRAATR